MAARIIDGKAVAARLRGEIAADVAALRQKGIVPGLAVVMVGNDPSNLSYIAGKKKACGELGLYSEEYLLPEATPERDVLLLVRKLNGSKKIHGILVQLPLPGHIDADRIIETIAPEKDVDGFAPSSVGKLVLGRGEYLPCTPHGVLKLLEDIGVKPDGLHAVIVGRSNIVGKPLANLLLQKAPNANATVTVCHTGTKNLSEHTRRADILIACVGRARMIRADMIKPGAVVIDVGVNRLDDPSAKKGYRLVGDVDFDGALEVASAITPVPGGVGPLTITMLMHNTVRAAAAASGKGPLPGRQYA